MKVFIRGIGPTTLSQSEFVARGGQGSVYARGDVAFKIYDDPSKAICSAKLAELSLIDDHFVLTPESLLLDPASHRTVGYTMRFMPNAFSLGQLFSRAFRQRHGVTPAQTLGLLDSLRQRIARVHTANCLVVDLNEMNFILPPSLDAIYAIDTDSFQTPSFPAVAIAPSVHDPKVRALDFSIDSDWFSFAVLAFQMLVGVHPYKGKHPVVTGLENRMAAGISVLDPAVTIPKSCRPLGGLPKSYRTFFEAVFREGKRPPPPEVKADGTVIQGPSCARDMHAGAIRLHEIGSANSPLRRIYDESSALLARTETSVYLDGKHRGALPAPNAEIVLSPKMLRPIAAWLDSKGRLQLQGLKPATRIETSLTGEQLLVHGGQLYLRADKRLLEIELHDVGPAVIASTELRAHISPHATRLFPGLVVQSLLGSCYVSLLDDGSGARQVHLRELDGQRIVDAKYDRGVLIAIAHHRGGYDRYTYRFGTHEKDLRIDRDVDSPTVDFVCLPAGVCVSRREEDHIEIFSSRPGHDKSRLIEDVALNASSTLARQGSRVLIAQGKTLLHMTMS